MSTKKNKPVEAIYVTRTTFVPLTENELFARMQELPLVISQQDRLAMRRKDLMAELKAEAEDLAEKIATLTGEINRKERTEDLRCLKHPVLTERLWHIMHPMTGEVMEKIPMGWEEYERLRNAAREAEAEATAETQLDLPLAEAGPIVTPPQPPLLGLPAVSMPMPPVGEELPLLAIAAKHVDEDVIEGELVAPAPEPGCYMGYDPKRFPWPAESTNGMLYHALHRYGKKDCPLSEDLLEPRWWQGEGEEIPTDEQLLEYLAEAWGDHDVVCSSGNKHDVKLVAMWNGKDGFRVRLSENCFDDNDRPAGSRSFQRSGKELAKAIRNLLFAPLAGESSAPEPAGSTDEDLTPYLLPLVLNEEPRMSATGGGISSVCTTLEQMLADLRELESDDRFVGHYAFAVAALKAGLGFMFIRQWTGQKSAWTQAINLAQTITGEHRTDFPKAIELLPAFAAHLEATKTPKNPKAGLKSWNPKGDAEELQKAVQQGNEAISALFGEAQTTGELVNDMASRLV